MVDFPLPDSPTRPSVSPRRTSRSHAVHSPHHLAATRREVDVQVPDPGDDVGARVTSGAAVTTPPPSTAEAGAR